MDVKRILQEISKNLEAVIAQDTSMGTSLWQSFIDMHPADIAEFLTNIDYQSFKSLFVMLSKELKEEVFEELSDKMKVRVLSFVEEKERTHLLRVLHADELTDLFDVLSDDQLKEYMQLLTKHAREQVLSLLKFHPESAGGIMDTEVLTLMQDFTVEKSIKLLQRLRPSRDIYQQIYVTDILHRLVGYINLEDLVLNAPRDRIGSFLREMEYVAKATEDQEIVAQQMVHYGLMTVPVVDDNNYFLGAIPSETLVDVLVEEASEDMQKMAALTPMKHTYFETSFYRMLYQRSYVLVILLLVESFVTIIMKGYESTLHLGSLLYFTTMLTSAGGNTSHQTSTVVIQSIASGDISADNIFRFLKREFTMAAMLALVLGATAFTRAWFTTYDFWQTLVISTSLSLIVLTSVSLGSCIPLILRRLNIDPAFSAGPFLATLMDIIGILIYCYMSQLLLS
ncbi:magnesium transporter [Candidatus Dependentiae bacterium]|nr:magnesium transporter [Candidatus Dependentiae bacterium]